MWFEESRIRRGAFCAKKKKKKRCKAGRKEGKRSIFLQPPSKRGSRNLSVFHIRRRALSLSRSFFFFLSFFFSSILSYSLASLFLSLFLLAYQSRYYTSIEILSTSVFFFRPLWQLLWGNFILARITLFNDHRFLSTFFYGAVARIKIFTIE